jgi:ABC-type branched-subunit amino acid transport system substrate-binding protein
MGQVIKFHGISRLDLDPNDIIEQIRDLKLDGIVILGYTQDNREFFATSYADGGTVLWLMEQCKRDLLDVDPAPVDR